MRVTNGKNWVRNDQCALRYFRINLHINMAVIVQKRERERERLIFKFELRLNLFDLDVRGSTIFDNAANFT